MNIDADKILFQAIQDGLREGITKKLSDYNSPINKLLEECIKENSPQLRELMNKGLAAALENGDFQTKVIDAMSHKLGTLLISRFGGEVEKQVNALKSDPTTRARITLAIDEIIAGKGK